MDNLQKVTKAKLPKLPRAQSQRIRAVTRKNYGDKKTDLLSGEIINILENYLSK